MFDHITSSVNKQKAAPLLHFYGAGSQLGVTHSMWFLSLQLIKSKQFRQAGSKSISEVNLDSAMFRVHTNHHIPIYQLAYQLHIPGRRQSAMCVECMGQKQYRDLYPWETCFHDFKTILLEKYSVFWNKTQSSHMKNVPWNISCINKNC